MAHFSVVVPTYNRPEQLSHCLQALSALAYPKDRYEIIIVDDGSPAPANEQIVRAVSRHQESHPGLCFRLLTQKNAGPATARNHGLREATGEFIAFTDDDCAPDPGWLTAFAQGFATNPQDMLGGRTINLLKNDPCAAASQVLMDYLYRCWNNPGTNRGATFFASNNIAFLATALRDLGGFDIGFPLAAAEDRDMCRRWLAAGRKMTYIADAVIGHFHGMSLGKFYRQHHNYGRGAFHYHHHTTRESDLPSQPVRIAPVRFYSELLLCPFHLRSAQRGHSPFVLSALLFLSQFANATGYFGEKRRWQRARVVHQRTQEQNVP
ncbi:MAG: glycosyltransferase [Akkermansiaceae bacterium]|nr:glycosyltransferase [Armatimonadota bacterium]